MWAVHVAHAARVPVGGGPAQPGPHPRAAGPRPRARCTQTAPRHACRRAGAGAGPVRMPGGGGRASYYELATTRLRGPGAPAGTLFSTLRLCPAARGLVCDASDAFGSPCPVPRGAAQRSTGARRRARSGPAAQAATWARPPPRAATGPRRPPPSPTHRPRTCTPLSSARSATSAGAAGASFPSSHRTLTAPVALSTDDTMPGAHVVTACATAVPPPVARRTHTVEPGCMCIASRAWGRGGRGAGTWEGRGVCARRSAEAPRAAGGWNGPASGKAQLSASGQALCRGLAAMGSAWGAG
jgi:hypothetical protein